MNKLIYGLVLTMIFSTNLFAQKLNNAKDSISYAYGVTMANDLISQDYRDMDVDIVIQAFKQAMNNKDLLIDAENANMLVDKAMVDNAKLAGTRFLVEKAKEDGIKSMEGGMLYEILKEGSGGSPKPGSDVTIHYEGRTLEGVIFDSSYERGQPATFNLKRLIKGWQIAVPDMKVGEKRRLYIPSDLAYGARGAGKDIKPYATLIFDIELIDF